MSEATDLLPFFQTEWAKRFTDSCVVKRATGQSFSDITGTYTPTYTTNYSGPCLIRPLNAGDLSVGEEQVGTRGYAVFIPYTETDQLRGDVVDVTSATDAFLTGKSFVVSNLPGDTYITKRTLICDEVLD